MAYPSIVKTYAQKKYNVTKKTGRAIKYVVIHYTATDASAKNNCIYFGGGNRNASADWFIDKDGTIYQFNADPANYYSWHCGASSKYTKYVYNSNSVGIEVVSTGGEYTSAQKDALRKLVTALMEDYGISASNVVRHYDCNAVRKLCPFAYCGTAARDAKWEELRKYITGGSATATATKTVKKTTTTKTGGSTVSITLRVLSKGSEGTQVKTLQRLLNALGYSCGNVDGDFGSKTDAAVRKYQKAKGLTVDGYCGKNTWGKLLGA